MCFCNIPAEKFGFSILGRTSTENHRALRRKTGYEPLRLVITTAESDSTTTTANWPREDRARTSQRSRSKSAMDRGRMACPFQNPWHVVHSFR
jgi:hypothetical protein